VSWQLHSSLTCLMTSCDLPFTKSYRTPSDSAVLSPNIRVSYSTMLLVALKSRWTMYLNCSPVGGEEQDPRTGPHAFMRSHRRRESSVAW
jgi:hypothetical protein